MDRRRSRSSSRKGSSEQPYTGPMSLPMGMGPPPLMPHGHHQRHASLGRLPLQELQHSSLHSRPGGDSRTLSPERKPMPKTSPYHSSLMAMSANKSGSYNGYLQGPPPPPLVPPPNASSISSASTIAMGVSGTQYSQPQPPPRAPISTSTPQGTPQKSDYDTHKMTNHHPVSQRNHPPAQQKNNQQVILTLQRQFFWTIVLP